MSLSCGNKKGSETSKKSVINLIEYIFKNNENKNTKNTNQA